MYSEKFHELIDGKCEKCRKSKIVDKLTKKVANVDLPTPGGINVGMLFRSQGLYIGWGGALERGKLGSSGAITARTHRQATEAEISASIITWSLIDGFYAKSPVHIAKRSKTLSTSTYPTHDDAGREYGGFSSLFMYVNAAKKEEIEPWPKASVCVVMHVRRRTGQTKRSQRGTELPAATM